MKKFLFYIFAVGSLLYVSSCTKGFEEMNKDPKNPTTTTINPVFNQLCSYLLLGWQEQAGLDNTYYYYYGQQAGRYGISGYIIDNSIDELWNGYYQMLSNYRLLERLFVSYKGGQDLTNVKAMSKVLLAYRTLRMTEAFGDMPYSLAGKAVDGTNFYRVKYDTQKSIYESCLTDLKWAVDNIQPGNANMYSVGGSDTFLGGNLNLWKKFANSLLLRYSLRIYDKNQAFAAPLVQAAAADPTKLLADGEDVCLWPKKLAGLDHQSTGWSFWSENMLRMGTAMWNMMSTTNNTDGSGIIDPRCYVFFEPNNAGKWVPYPQNPSSATLAEGGWVYKTDKRDANWADKGIDNLYSPFNYFLVRDTKDVPEFIQTSAEVHFLRAEAYAKGAGVTASLPTAKTEYEQGIKASINFWYSIPSTTGIWTVNIPVKPTTSQIDAFIANPKIAWDNTKALSLIYAQRWVDNFRQPWEGFNLWNYTNMTPRDITGSYDANKYAFYRLHYPNSEKNYNTANWKAATADGTTDKETVKLFWQK